MANIKSQIKRIKQNEQRRLRNKAVKSGLRTAQRHFAEAVESGDAAKAQELARSLGARLDRAASRGVIHKNQAANRKSSVFKKASAV